ncbi:hypothetical protein PVAP13_8KG232500 [Panicum virgatum]|uniref:Uncharacterized protein n=1 Tax=Panicum virgatum TaxID=38727 RepID=A0A8T0PIQ9_PANVG|nr:hypothetical protein PVAP13_8KG232500 [Panicum virgatum]
MNKYLNRTGSGFIPLFPSYHPALSIVRAHIVGASPHAKEYNTATALISRGRTSKPALCLGPIWPTELGDQLQCSQPRLTGSRPRTSSSSALARTRGDRRWPQFLYIPFPDFYYVSIRDAVN